MGKVCYLQHPVGYFISPVDAMLDIIPFAGFADDMIVLITAVGIVIAHIDEGVRNKTCQTLIKWFGN